MNERIRELAVEASVNVITTKGMEHVVDGCYIVSPDRLDEFALLIVKECKKAIDPTGDLTSMSEAGWREECMKMIDEHFGVEE
jgi:hypothetical protein